MAAPFEHFDTLYVLARTVWGEARGDGTEGMTGVACCILNRAAHPRWWGSTIQDVCLAPWQFSCWNSADPNLPKMLSVNTSDPDFATALDIAGRAIAGLLTPDSTLGADSYYDIRMSSPPPWANRAAETIVLQHHRYMRVELACPDGTASAPPVSMHAALSIRADAAERAAGAR